ncbi:choice-of-anchor G family protein [Solicola sp. PLA-1-18]|uniref:choice-of-anchor G family protein n=1 Tax=Solicola sp. PLA-1-18 TaxID=3380532 RepID=UPI003B78E685
MRVRRAVLTCSTVVGLAAVSVTAFGPMAAAATGDTSRAEGRFLSGSAFGNSFDTVAKLDGATAERSGDTARDVSANDLSGSVLGQALPSQAGGLTIPLDQLVTLGAANQYAEATSRASSRAASGAVADSGAVNTAKSDEYPASLELSLEKLFSTNGVPDELADQLQVDLELRGLAAVAQLDATKGQELAETCTTLGDPAQCRDYDLATAKATIGVPALGDLLRTILDTVATGEFSTTSCDAVPAGPAKDLCTTLAGLQGQSPVKVRPVGFDLATTLDSITTTATGNGVAIDLRKGTVTVDLAALVEKATGKAINDQPPNTDLVPILAQALADLPTLLSDSLDEALDQITTQLGQAGVEVTIGNAAPITLTGAQAAGSLKLITDPLSEAISAGAKQLTTSLAPLTDQLAALDQVVSLQLNVQDSPADGVFRETALKATLLKAAGGAALPVPGGAAATDEPGIVLNLAQAQVGANTLGEDAAVPVTPVGNPQGGPNLPNTGAGTLDLPFLLLGLGLLTGGMWVVMWGRNETVPD